MQLYLHMKDNLHFSDIFIGELNGFFAIAGFFVLRKLDVGRVDHTQPNH